MNLSRTEIRVLLLHEFRLGRRATKATGNMRNTMDEDVLSILTAQYWFHNCKNGDFELDDLSRSGRPLELDSKLVIQITEENPSLTS